MFWIYGGNYQFGANSLPLYDGSYLAGFQNVVIVTINYRTNIFGFPGWPNPNVSEWNLGLLDQHLALQWVRDNINQFGGDPGKITLFGQSAGALSVEALVTLPPRFPMQFRGAIMESGAASFAPGFDTNGTYLNGASFASWNKTATSMGMDPASSATLRAIQGMDAMQLKNKIEELNLLFYAYKGDNATTWVGNPRQRRAAHQISTVPILTGSNADEASFYLPGASAEAQRDFTEVAFQCPAKYLANETTAIGVAAWRYFFDATFPNYFPNLGAFHTAEIEEVFGTYNRTGATQRQIDISNEMMTAWANFAKDPMGGPG
ncbi:alpha/beta-hydrolase, partial [Polyplosphaeria fusca]